MLRCRGYFFFSLLLQFLKAVKAFCQFLQAINPKYPEKFWLGSSIHLFFNLPSGLVSFWFPVYFFMCILHYATRSISYVSKPTLFSSFKCLYNVFFYLQCLISFFLILFHIHLFDNFFMTKNVS